MKRIAILLLAACAFVAAQLKPSRSVGEEWMMLVYYPITCSNITLTGTTSTTTMYTYPCRSESMTDIRWFKTEAEAIEWANATQDEIVGLYHVDRETKLAASEYEQAIKQPDKIEHRKKYAKVKP